MSEIAFAHTRNCRDRIIDARLAVTGVRKATAAWRRIANQLAVMPDAQRRTAAQIGRTTSSTSAAPATAARS